MPLCPECDKTFFSSVTALWLHLSLVHKVEKTSSFRCKEQGCFRNLSNWKQYRKHLLNIHNCYVITWEGNSSCNKSDSQNCIEGKSFNEHETNTIDSPLEPDVQEWDLDDTLNQLTMKFIVKLYANHTIPRSFVQDVFLDVKDLVHEIISSMKRQIRDRISQTDSCFEVVESILDKYHDPFNRLCTEYRCFKTFEEAGYLVPMESYIVGNRVDDKLKNTSIIKEIVPVTAEFIPMRNVLQKVFSLPGVFSTVDKYIKKLQSENDSIENFVQGRLWKDKVAKNFQNKTVFPLFLYFDDFEICNPLGSHAGVHKLGGVYYQVACFPPEVNSLLENIFLCALFHSSDRTEFRNRRIFQKIIDELNFLQAVGIDVKTESGIKRIYFALGLVLGDNLGLNSILGFVESFRAHFSCRLCTLSREEAQMVFFEKSMRYETYEVDFEKSNVSETGIKEKSVWNDVLFFETEKNFVVDLLHDGPEGYFSFHMRLVLRYFVKDFQPKEERLKLSILNSRLNSFNYYHNGLSNKIPNISEAELDHCKLKMSGIEMMNFVYLFSMLVGDLIQQKDPVWKMYIHLRQIVDIIMCHTVFEGGINLLRVLIAENLAMYKEVFPNERVKPKMHDFIHYPTVMEQCGPIVKLSSLRFESKHKKKKIEANATSSRKNITYTLGIKERLVMCYRFMTGKGLFAKDNSGVEKFIGDLSHCSNYQLFKHTLSSEFKGLCLQLSWVKKNGIIYRPGMCVIIEMMGNDEILPVFGFIEQIIKNDKGSVGCVCKVLLCYGFDYNFHAYDVFWTKKLTFVIINDLVSPFPAILVCMGNGTMFATVKHKI